MIIIILIIIIIIIILEQLIRAIYLHIRFMAIGIATFFLKKIVCLFAHKNCENATVKVWVGFLGKKQTNRS